MAEELTLRKDKTQKNLPSILPLGMKSFGLFFFKKTQRREINLFFTNKPWGFFPFREIKINHSKERNYTYRGC